MRWFGGLPRDEGFGLPSRHLGLVQADEVADVEARLDRAAEALGRLQPAMPDPVVFAPAMLPPEQAWLGESGGRALQGVRIGVAPDPAFPLPSPSHHRLR